MATNKPKIKLNLGATPGPFKREVEVPMLDGKVVTIELEFVYRTRSEFGALMDEINNPVKATSSGKSKAKQEVSEELSEESLGRQMEQLFSKGTQSNVEYLQKIVTGWDLMDDFNVENIQKLCNVYPGAVHAIAEAYRAAISEGRVKN